MKNVPGFERSSVKMNWWDIQRGGSVPYRTEPLIVTKIPSIFPEPIKFINQPSLKKKVNIYTILSSSFNIFLIKVKMSKPYRIWVDYPWTELRVPLTADFEPNSKKQDLEVHGHSRRWHYLAYTFLIRTNRRSIHCMDCMHPFHNKA
jgi:hypothetical protein